jgi:hypothetical protein
VVGSRDTRAAGIPWLFAPLVGIAIDPRWSRIYETFGEDMVVVGSMAKAMVQGIQTQGDGIHPERLRQQSISLDTQPPTRDTNHKHPVGFHNDNCISTSYRHGDK